MLDFVMIAIGVGFFVAAILYVLACDKNVRRPCCSITSSARSRPS